MSTPPTTTLPMPYPARSVEPRPRAVAMVAVLAFVLACLYLLTSGATAAEPATAATDALPPVRHENALVTIPDGWTSQRLEFSGWLALNGGHEQCNIYLRDARPIDPATGLAGAMDAVVADMVGGGNDKTVVDEAPPVTARHPGGGDALTRFVSIQTAGFTAKGYYLITVVDGGDLAQPFVLEGADNFYHQHVEGRVLVEQNRPVFERLVHGARLPSRIVLAPAPAGAPGAKPLTLHTVYQVSDFVEWLLDVPFTQAQRDAVRAHLVGAWTRGEREEIDGVGEIAKVRGQLAALDRDRKELTRQAARAEVLKLWRDAGANGDAVARLMVEAYDAAHAPLAQGAAGEPPLTRQSADAALEAVYFMAAQVAGAGAPESRPDAAQRDAWATELAAAYPAMPADQKRDLADMPVTWAALRLGWDGLPADQRAALVAEWARVPLVQQTVGQIGKAASAAESKRIAEIYRHHESHRRLINMGAYNLPRTPYRF